MDNETKCIYAVFDIFWKKYKCTSFQHVIFETDICNTCWRYREKENNNEKTDTNKT